MNPTGDEERAPGVAPGVGIENVAQLPTGFCLPLESAEGVGSDHAAEVKRSTEAVEGWDGPTAEGEVENEEDLGEGEP